MVDTAPFSKAEEVWNDVMERIETRATAEHGDPFGFVYDFAQLNVPEARRIRVEYSHGGGKAEMQVILDSSVYAHRWPGSYNFDIGLSPADDEVLKDFLLLGAVMGFWAVHGVYAITGRVLVPRVQYFNRYERPSTGVGAMQLLAALCGGELEAAWSRRKEYFEAGWSAYQVAMAAEFETAGWAPLRDPYDEPEYLLPDS